jgi:3-hydroxyisobutyrate dehydrogenase
VLGLGAMGLPMATRLASKLTVHGFDVVETRLKLAADAGVIRFEPARLAATGADAALAVRNSEQLNDVLLGAEGVGADACARLRRDPDQHGRGRGDPRDCREAGDLRHLTGGRAIVAGPVRAGQGDLLIVVGAEPEALERARPVLELRASTLTVVGDKPGDGQALKTVNRLLCGVHIAPAAEAHALAAATETRPPRCG